MFTRECCRYPPKCSAQLAQRADVHLYSEQNDVVMAGKRLGRVHATTAGTKTIRLPNAADCRDAVSGEVFGTGRYFLVHSDKLATRNSYE